MEVVERVARVLGGRAVLRRTVRTWGDLDRVVRAGLPKRSLQSVAQRAFVSGASANEFVYSVVPSATFKRRTTLSADESARTERLARIVAIADAVWLDESLTRAFLNRPHPLLGNETPIDVARTELGARRVEGLVHDIDHGLPL